MASSWPRNLIVATVLERWLFAVTSMSGFCLQFMKQSPLHLTATELSEAEARVALQGKLQAQLCECSGPKQADLLQQTEPEASKCPAWIFAKADEEAPHFAFVSSPSRRVLCILLPLLASS